MAWPGYKTRVTLFCFTSHSIVGDITFYRDQGWANKTLIGPMFSLVELVLFGLVRYLFVFGYGCFKSYLDAMKSKHGLLNVKLNWKVLACSDCVDPFTLELVWAGSI